MSATVGSYRVTDRDIADLTREAITTTFTVVAETLQKSPEEMSAPEAGRRLLAQRDTLIARLVETFDEKLKEGPLDA